MYYSAESIIAELKANKDIICKGINEVGCPSPSTAEHECSGNPNECDRCIAKECEQPVSIHRDYKLLRILVFRFMIRNNTGFVHRTDSVLKQLFKYNLIDENKLEPV